ncbi:hypothetical protein SynMITS9220_00658 [Synechococcus sp. MIT S9220]|uniref:hypothetical protein n=1 Tax=unclassified Synechococcus TaxID=2626047 RepID=UPI00164A8ADD|nr:hypothetical protein [Synechococcus sp. MIT S9220]QNJ21971.1 hypothetical protein SynMITS9220_00658 [Synechococcus sp. MIT S9220]
MTMQPNRKLDLHIGLPKTGSSTIQTFLHSQRQEISKQSIEIPTCLGPYSHYKLALMFYSTNHKADFLAKNNHLQTTEERLKFRALWEASLKEELESKPNQQWIISSEFLQHCLQAEHEITSLAEMLRQYFNEINLLLYVRKPIRAAVSMMSTEVKMGKHKFEIERPAYYRNLCNHQQTITIWQNAFRPDHFKIRDYDSQQKYGTLLQDFCKHTGITWRDSFGQTRRSNQSLSLKGLQIMTSLNRQMRASKTKVDTRKRFRFIDYVIKHYQETDSYEATYKQSKEFSDYYHSSNTWLKQTQGINYVEDFTKSLPSAQDQHQTKTSTITDSDAMDIWKQWNARVDQPSC